MTVLRTGYSGKAVRPNTCRHAHSNGSGVASQGLAAVVIPVFLFLDLRDNSEAGDSGFGRQSCEEFRLTRDHFPGCNQSGKTGRYDLATGLRVFVLLGSHTFRYTPTQQSKSQLPWNCGAKGA